MELIDRLKSVVGIGAPTLAIEGVAGPVRAGEVLRGTLVVLGGDYEVQVRKVALHFDEQQLTYTTPSGAADPERVSLRRLTAVELDLGEQALASGERRAQAFTLALPAELEPSAGTRCYALLAECEVSGLNPRVELPLDVVA